MTHLAKFTKELLQLGVGSLHGQASDKQVVAGVLVLVALAAPAVVVVVWQRWAKKPRHGRNGVVLGAGLICASCRHGWVAAKMSWKIGAERSAFSAMMGVEHDESSSPAKRDCAVRDGC